MSEETFDTGANNEAVAETEINEQVESTETTEQAANPEGEQNSEESEQKAEHENQEKAKKQRQHALDERFRELTGQQKEAIRSRDHYKQLYEQTVAKYQPQITSEPTLDQFETIPEFVEATKAYVKEQAQREVMQQQNNMQQQQQAMQQQAEWEAVKARIDKDEEIFTRSHPDFPEASRRFTAIATPEYMNPTVIRSVLCDPDAVAIAYELSKDMNDLLEFQALTAEQQLIRIGEIKASKVSKSHKTTANVPKAPPPVTPTKGNATAKRDTSKMSDAEWFASRKNK